MILTSCIVILFAFGSVQNFPGNKRLESESVFQRYLNKRGLDCPQSAYCKSFVSYSKEDPGCLISCERVSGPKFVGIINPNDSARIYCRREETDSDVKILKGLLPDFTSVLNSIQRLSFNDCQLPKGPLKELLETVGVNNTDELYFTGSRSTNISLPTDYLAGLENLKGLSLPQNEIRDLPVDFFKELVNLTKLDLSENNLTLSKNLFSHTTQLEELNLSGNKIDESEEPILTNYNKLKFLTVSGNQLSYFSRNVFPQLPQLEKLHIYQYKSFTSSSNNSLQGLKNVKELRFIKSISSFSNGLLSDTPKLEEIYLQYNEQPLILPNYFLSNLTILKTVYLDSNKMFSIPEETFWNSKSIKNIYLPGNFLFVLPENLFRDQTDLETLNLRYNQLKFLSDQNFKNLINLKSLLLDNNNLQNISFKLFDGLINLELLDLGGNKLKYINSKAFQPLVKLQQVLLNNNQLSFLGDEGSSFFPIGIQEIYLNDNKFEKLSSSMIKFFNESTTIDTITLYNNPWICDCSARELINMLVNRCRAVNHYWITFSTSSSFETFGGPDVICASNKRSLFHISESEICPTQVELKNLSGKPSDEC